MSSKASTPTPASSASTSSTSSTKGTPNSHQRELLRKSSLHLMKKIGSGAYGYTWSAMYYQHKAPATVVAIKLISCKGADSEYVRKFLPRELAILKRVRHTNITAVMDVVRFKEEVGIVMELVTGGDLLSYLLEHHIVPGDKARVITSELAEALWYLHSVCIAHRDLKCENVLLTRDMHVRLCDFGFARQFIQCQDQMSHTYCGSFAYAPPEVNMGRPYHPMCADMWSLGAIIFTMVTGTMPFDDRDRRQMINCQLAGEWHFPTACDTRQLPVSCRELVRDLLRTNPAERLQPRDVLKSFWLNRGNLLPCRFYDQHYLAPSGVPQEDDAARSTDRLSITAYQMTSASQPPPKHASLTT